MKKLLILISLLAATFVTALAGPAHAGDFWDAVATTPTTVDLVTFDMQTVINQATVTATWNEAAAAGGGLVGVFDGADTLPTPLNIYDRSGVLVLQSPANITRIQLDAWAAANAETIFNIVFPAGLSELSGSTDDSTLVSTTVSRVLFSKVVPARKSKESGNGGTEPANQEVAQGDLEYQHLKVAGNHGRASSMVLGFAKEMDSGLSYSLTVPYRYTKINDDINSRSHFVGLDLALTYPVAKWDRSQWFLGGCLFGSSYFLRTDTIEKAGNLKYGGGVFTSLQNDLGFGTLGAGVDYRLAKAYMPSSMNDENYFVDQARSYINHHSPIQIVSYGFNLGVPVGGEAAALNLEVVRSSFSGNDVPDDQKDKTTVSLGWTSYLSDTFELNLGINRDFEMGRVDSMGVMLGVINRF